MMLSLLVAPMVRALRRIRVGQTSSVLIAVLALTLSCMAVAVVLGTQILRSLLSTTRSLVARHSRYPRRSPPRASRESGRRCASGTCTSKSTKCLPINWRRSHRHFGTLTMSRHRHCVSSFLERGNRQPAAQFRTPSLLAGMGSRSAQGFLMTVSESWKDSSRRVSLNSPRNQQADAPAVGAR
jgi:hypothetical protein